MSVSAADITGRSAAPGNDLLSLATLMANPETFSAKIQEFVEEGARASAAVEEMKLGMAAQEALRQAQAKLNEADSALAVAKVNAENLLAKAKADATELRTKAEAILANAQREADMVTAAAQENATRVVLEADRVKAEADKLSREAFDLQLQGSQFRKEAEELKEAVLTDRRQAEVEISRARELINGIRALANRFGG